jgi:hypothetical protein
MELIQMKVGERFPIQKVIDHFKGNDGASLDYSREEKTLSLYVALNSPRSKEINSFNKDIIRFGFYRNELLDTAIIMIYIGTDLVFDLVYDINVLDVDMDGIIEGNRFDMYLIDSKTGILKAMRMIGLGENFISELNRICRNDRRYTSKEYNEWLQNDVYKKSLNQLWRESEKIEWYK